MKSPYVIIEQQTDSRIELAKSQHEKGYHFFAESTIIQAYEAVDRFEKRLDNVRFDRLKPFVGSFNLEIIRYLNEKRITENVSELLISDIDSAVEEMGEMKRENVRRE